MAVGDRDGLDDLDRLFRHLVSVLADQSPDRLHAPFEVAELYQQLVPYRQHRAALKLDTNQDYEMAVLRLLSGDRGFASIEPAEVQQVLRDEARSVNPDPGLFREFAAARVTLDAAAVRTALEARNAFVPSAPTAERRPLRGMTAEPSGQREGAAVRDDPDGGSCPHCGQELPTNRALFYCPFCGRNVKGVECPRCGTGLEAGWMFCITCGHRSPGSAKE